MLELRRHAVCFFPAMVLCAACSSPAETTGSGGAGPTTGSGGTTQGSGGQGGTGGGGGEGGKSGASFAYKPGWSGVTAVSVVGAFGTATDWDPGGPFLKLKDDGTGTWKGTADLPEGQYLYIYHVIGDKDGKAGLDRYAIDPSVGGYDLCPTASPSYKEGFANPCSNLTVPQPASEPQYHITGQVVYGGAPAEGYLVEIDRAEGDDHHFFANRTNSLADGTFDLPAAAANYRIYVFHPTFQLKTDVERDPLALKAIRRAFSSPISLTEDYKLGALDAEYAEYDKLSPVGTSTLPTTFNITVLPGSQDARLAIYGTKSVGGKTIYDPWYQSDYLTVTSVAFDGMFNTAYKSETEAVVGEQYYWGTWQRKSAGDKKLWTIQSMVFPITWN
jgi:hypothetical protein